ncbi:MAG: hypothetical protein VKP62_14400 [Candidatus Sericytochromatia bacterium]|nr:hypothetical protein [Candidatus Sericytochromatia bacterium]
MTPDPTTAPCCHDQQYNNRARVPQAEAHLADPAQRLHRLTRDWLTQP